MGAEQPPTWARERPEALTVRARSSSEVCSSMSSAVPPASSASSRARCPWGRRITASARALLAPLRTLDASDRAPRSMPRAVTTIVLPAPVSPVSTENPGSRGSLASVMMPRSRIWISSITNVHSFSLVLLGVLRTTPATDRKLKFTHQSLREGSRVDTGE